MYLKRIELQGFKSFFDKTVIEIDRGITAIVGPNGSGKSNISDAVRWVMGEQSAKTLRGSKMEDVIFAGTAKRKPLSFAEVTLVLDNSNGELPCEYSEVEVSRRVYRSGEGEYFINKNACRMKDIHELFMDTGLGRDGYSIVGQGKIDEILSAKSEDRREVFEEAAGISKYRYRKSDAERKLLRTDENLSRVKDILSEITERVEPLRVQSEKARKFLDLREQLKSIEVSALLDIIDARRGALEENEKLYLQASGNFEAAKNTLAEYDRKTDELYNASKAQDSELEALRGRQSELETRRTEIAGEKNLTLSNIENLKSNILTLDADLEGFGRQKESIASGEGEIASRLAAYEEKLDKLDAGQQEIEKDLAAVSANITEKNASLENLRSEIASYEQKRLDAQSRIDSMQMFLAGVDERKATIEEEIINAAKEVEKHEKSASELLESVASLEKNKDKIENERFNASRAAASAAAKADELKHEYNEVNALLSEKSAKRDMLSEMEKGLEGYARGVRELLKAKNDGRFDGDFIGVLSKLIEVEKKYTAAIEAALGNTMQNVVVSVEEDAKRAIEFLKKNSLGTVTFLPLSAQEGRRLDNESKILSHRGVLAVASDVVERGGELDEAIEALLGRTVIVDGMDNAIALAREYRYRFKIVTTDGEILQTGGSITGGSRNLSGALLSRADEIEALEKECEELKRRGEKLDDLIEDAMEEAALSRKHENELRTAFDAAQTDFLRVQADQRFREQLLSAAKERGARLRDEKEQLYRQITDAGTLTEQLCGDIEAYLKLIEEKRAEEAEKQALLFAEIKVREEVSDRLIAKKMDVNACLKDIEIERERRSDIKKRIAELEASHEGKINLRANMEKRIADLESSLDGNSERTAALENEIETVKAEITLRLEGKSVTDEEIVATREVMRTMNETILTLQAECVKIESKRARLEGDLESATNRLWDDYELTYTTASEHRRDVGSMTAAQREISSLKNQIKALGNINIDAIEEYKEVKERYEFLTAQVSDLESAKAGLEKIIREMTGVMCEQFSEKFALINEKFGKAFTDLFGGGKASVSLTDPLDVLGSGIEIEVQPPGKKLQSITLLSGGERAFTAIALLFAFLQVQPSPFLILDEIESALDDENVYRFADYVRNYEDTTQFIVITHRRGTMESADMLYGVTMQERGVSKLLSMHLSEVASLSKQ